MTDTFRPYSVHSWRSGRTDVGSSSSVAIATETKAYIQCSTDRFRMVSIAIAKEDGRQSWPTGEHWIRPYSLAIFRAIEWRRIIVINSYF